MKADLKLIRTTFFRNKSAATLTARDMSLEELRELIRGKNADIKDDLPWLKLATFGGKRSDKGSLRHDANVISISGIGPKVALAVLSGIEPADLVRAIRHGDLARLTSIPGVGKKTAERMVIELRDRMPAGVEAGAPAVPGGEDVRADVLSALGNLGYQRAAAEKAVDRVLGRATDTSFEPLLRQVLRELAK